MAKTMLLKNAIALVADYSCEKFPPTKPGRTRYKINVHSDSVYIEVEKSFSVRANVQFDFRYDHDTKTYDFRSQIGWSSSIRSLANAKACVDLYNEIISFTALIESVVAELPSVIAEE